MAPSVLQVQTIGGLERVGDVLFGPGPTTALVLTADGYLASSAFAFLNRPASILVQVPGGSRKPARLIATDHNRMIVLLKVEPDAPLPVAETAPAAEVRVGQWAIAVGRALDPSRPNLAVGVVSATNRIWGKALQTDAAVSPLNYGGPLVDIRGRVIGLIVPLSPEEGSELAGYEWYDSGIGFAVPAQTLAELLPRLQKGKDLRPGLTGLGISPRTLMTAEPVLGPSRPRSPAHQAGLKAGDRIIEIEGRSIDRAAQVKQEIAQRYAGDTLRMVVLRDGKRVACELQLADKLEPYRQPLFGVLPLRPLPSQPEAQAQGIAVRYVFPDSPAAKAGVEAGDALISFNEKPIADLHVFRLQFEQMQPGDKATFKIRHGGQTRNVDVVLAAAPQTLPPSELPPAHAKVESDKADRPPLGIIPLKNPATTIETWAYVPPHYQAEVPHGLVVWLHGPEGLDPKEFLARCQPWADRHDLIVVAPKAAGSRFRPNELSQLPVVLAPVINSYSIHPNRVVVAGRESGGTAAFQAAFAAGSLVRAVAVIDAPFIGRFPDRESFLKFSVYLARSEGSRWTGPIKETLSRLRAMQVPVTVKDLGPKPRDFTAEEMAELARWIDTLDRI